MTITRSTLLDVPLSRLRPYERNPRKNDPAVEAVAKSLAEFGYVKVSVLVDEEMILLAGHTTLKAMKRLGWTACPEVTVIDGLSNAQKTAYRLADNKLAEIAAWDDDALRAELQELQIEGFDLSLAGFDPAEWFPEAQPDPPHARVSEAEELARKWQTAPGQLWQCGDHRVLCGDSTNAADVARLLDGAVPFIMVTDPPYGVEYDPHWRDGPLGGTAIGNGVANDDRADWTPAYDLFPGDVAYIWHAALHATEVAVSMVASRFEIRTQIVWSKNRFAISRGHYHWQHEPCWYGVRKGRTAKWCGDRTQSTIWDITSLNVIGREEERVAHGTQKPVECMARPIRNHGGPGDDVYDPFLGSGTTLIACEQLGRRCFGMEIDPCYVAVILQRYQDLTGVAPELVEPEEDDGAT